MRAKEYREMTKEQLEKELNEKKAEVCRMRFDIGARQEKNYKKLTHAKKGIARMMTILVEKGADGAK